MQTQLIHSQYAHTLRTYLGQIHSYIGCEACRAGGFYGNPKVEKKIEQAREIERELHRITCIDYNMQYLID